MTAGWLAAASAVVERIGESHWPFFSVEKQKFMEEESSDVVPVREIL